MEPLPWCGWSFTTLDTALRREAAKFHLNGRQRKCPRLQHHLFSKEQVQGHALTAQGPSRLVLVGAGRHWLGCASVVLGSVCVLARRGGMGIQDSRRSPQHLHWFPSPLFTLRRVSFEIQMILTGEKFVLAVFLSVVACTFIVISEKSWLNQSPRDVLSDSSKASLLYLCL